jgi:hypothetical protein
MSVTSTLPRVVGLPVVAALVFAGPAAARAVAPPRPGTAAPATATTMTVDPATAPWPQLRPAARGTREVDGTLAATVTVRFVPLKGKLPASKRVRLRAAGARLGKLPVPKRRHHIFLGWARGSAGGRFVSAKTRAWTDLVLHAVWAKRGSHATWRAGNTMKLHVRPRAHSRLAAIVKRGTKVAIVARHGHWYKLRASKHRAGWVRLCYAAKGL